MTKITYGLEIQRLLVCSPPDQLLSFASDTQNCSYLSPDEPHPANFVADIFLASFTSLDLSVINPPLSTLVKLPTKVYSCYLAQIFASIIMIILMVAA